MKSQSSLTVGEAREETVYNFPVDMSDSDYKLFLNYADRNMTDKQLKDLKVEWALLNIIKEAVEND